MWSSVQIGGFQSLTAKIETTVMDSVTCAVGYMLNPILFYKPNFFYILAHWHWMYTKLAFSSSCLQCTQTYTDHFHCIILIPKITKKCVGSQASSGVLRCISFPLISLLFMDLLTIRHDGHGQKKYAYNVCVFRFNWVMNPRKRVILTLIAAVGSSKYSRENSNFRFSSFSLFY